MMRTSSFFFVFLAEPEATLKSSLPEIAKHEVHQSVSPFGARLEALTRSKRVQKGTCVKAFSMWRELVDGHDVPDPNVWAPRRHLLDTQVNRIDGNVSRLQDQISSVSSSVACMQRQMNQLTQAVAHITKLLSNSSTVTRDDLLQVGLT